MPEPIPVAAWSKAESAAARLLGLQVRISPGACMSVVSVVCCQVKVFVPGWSLVQRSPTERGVSEYDREAPTMKRPWPTKGSRATRRKKSVCLPNQKRQLVVKTRRQTRSGSQVCTHRAVWIHKDCVCEMMAIQNYVCVRYFMFGIKPLSLQKYLYCHCFYYCH